MKQQIIELKKKLLLVELPEGINGEDVSINHNQDDYEQLEFQYPTHEFRGMQCYDNILLPKGYSYKSIGKLTDITESLCAEWVFKSRIGTYKDYTCAPKSYDKIGLIDALLEMKFKTAKESFFSKLEAAGICFQSKNNLDKPDRNEYNFSYGHNESDLYNKHIKNWQEAESKLWKKDRCCLFEILN